MPLLIKRLQIIGLPNDVVSLVETWLTERFFFVEIDGIASEIKVTWYGIIQGSILGPVLYAIFMSPLFQIEKAVFYADDGFGLAVNKDKAVVARLIQTKLERIKKWLTQSGMKVNESKTCLSLFCSQDTTPIEITLNTVPIKSTTTINVLGVIFDQKLQWVSHISQCIAKSNKALAAIRMIRKFFNTNELLQLVTSNFYSILYYNSEIWHLPSLNANLKQKLLSSSARAIKTCVKFDSSNISFVNLHQMYQRATPDRILMYKHALALFKLFNTTHHTIEWAALNLNQVNTSRQLHFITRKSNLKRVGLNALANRFHILNGLIPLSVFDKSYDSFKVYCKKEFLIM